MNDLLIEKALGYVTEWTERLHLQDWSVKVGRGETNREEWIAASRTNWRDMIGSITIPPTYEAHLEREADLRRYVDLDRELENTIVHELLHIAWSSRITDIRDALHETLGEGARAGILSALERAEEFAVNMMVRALLDQKYHPRGDEKTSDEAPESTGHPWPFPLRPISCPDCANDPPTPPSGSFVPFQQASKLVPWTVAEYDRNVYHGDTACACDNCLSFRNWFASYPFAAPELFKPQ